MTDEERLTNLKQKVDNLKTDLAIKEDQKKTLLRDLKEHNIKDADEAKTMLESITKEIDKKETLRDQELNKAEAYLEQYDV